ncbi:MAG TPA: hypothetical protein VMX54_03310 [Vicinamibacteria bacterium]|nr:hypothetical protein [Vicinamibacteria bacterium]
MSMRRAVLLAASIALVGCASHGGPPALDVNPTRHPNLAAAQRLSRQAYERILTAQQANEWDMNGHAQKAKELLVQVNDEIKLAAEAANRHR